MRKTNFVLIALQITHLEAAVPLNDRKTLEINIPQQSLTRLSVQDDVIQDIFVYPQMIGGHLVQDSLQLHKSGHVFMAPEHRSQPFYLTVMTQKGKVQDLKIIPGSQDKGPVILTLPVPDLRAQDANQRRKKRFEAALMAALQGLVPPNFLKVSVDETPEESGDIQKTRCEAYRHHTTRIDVYTLDNRSDREIFLTPSLFLGSSDLAVVFEQPSVRSGGHVRLAVLRQERSSSASARKPLSLTQNSKG